jgi:ABC-2 type transport system permease protein
VTATATAQAAAEPGVRVQPAPLAAFWRQLRFIARRDRIRAPVWFAAVVGLVGASAVSVVALYTTDEDLQSYATLAQANVAFKAVTGPGYGLDDVTLGAVVMNEVALYTYVAVALMAVFMVVRHTRAEEETERAELVRAAPVGRYASLAATLVWVSGLVVVTAVGLTGTMLAVGLNATGSIAFGAASAAVGLVFVGVAAIAAQVAVTARAAKSLGGAVLGASFVIRGVADIGNGWMTWLSPLGITQAIRPFADERWWVLVPLAALAFVTTAAAAVLLGRRDLGAGILRQQPGPSTGSPRLGTPFALAVRLQRGSVIGWMVGLALTGFFIGLIADEAEALADNEAVAEMLARAGQGSITESLLATMTLMVALIGSGFTVSSVLRLRTEENALRADPILATPVDRRRWFASHYSVAIGGSLLLMLASGVMIGLGYLSATGRTDEFLPVMAAAAAQWVAMVVLGAFTLALTGFGTRWALFGWIGVIVGFVVGFLGNTLDLPQWARNVSPFEHVPAMPAAPFDATPLLVLAAVAVAFTTVAMIAIRRRDLG